MKSLRVRFELSTALPALQHSSREARGARTVKCARPTALHTWRPDRPVQARVATSPLRLRFCRGPWAPCTARALALRALCRGTSSHGLGQVAIGLEPAVPRHLLRAFNFHSLLRSRRGVFPALAVPVSRFCNHRFCMRRYFGPSPSHAFFLPLCCKFCGMRARRHALLLVSRKF